MDRAKLLEYVKCIYDVEASIFLQKRAYAVVNKEYNKAISCYNKSKMLAYKKTSSPRNDDIDLQFGAILSFVFSLSIVLIILFPSIKSMHIGIITALKAFFGGIILGPILGYTLGWFFQKVRNSIRNRQYIEKATMENVAIEAKNKKIKEQNEANRSKAIKAAEPIRKQLLRIKKDCGKTEEIKNQLYAKNIIYEKYRNFVAVSAFYEYLASGRCTQLEGPFGAYNKFEEELRLGIIIAKLDDVLHSLNRIEKNQAMLYNAIQRANENLLHIERGIRNISSSMSDIETNTEISAYNSEITRNNIEFMKQVQFWDMWFTRQ